MAPLFHVELLVEQPGLPAVRGGGIATARELSNGWRCRRWTCRRWVCLHSTCRRWACRRWTCRRWTCRRWGRCRLRDSAPNMMMDWTSHFALPSSYSFEGRSQGENGVSLSLDSPRRPPNSGRTLTP